MKGSFVLQARYFEILHFEFQLLEKSFERLLYNLYINRDFLYKLTFLMASAHPVELKDRQRLA